MGIEVNGIIGILVLALDIWAILHTVQAPAGIGAKLIWILLIVLLPVLGVVIWFFFGPRGNRAAP
jgi:hypothetical protein